MLIASEQIEKVENLYDRGLLLQAYAIAESFAPIETWRGTEARLLAGRLAFHLGNPRLAQALYLQAWRRDRQNAEAKNYYVCYTLNTKGILATWEYLQTAEYLTDATSKQQADWLCWRVFVLTQMRDFEAAELWLERAAQIAPSYLWVEIQRSHLLQAQDRYPEALAIAQNSLVQNPQQRVLIETIADLYVLLDRDREALELLTAASQTMEFGSILAQLAQLQIELGMYDGAHESYKRFEELSPLIDKHAHEWLVAGKLQTAYYKNDFTNAIAYARQINHPSYKNVEEQLNQSTGKRVILPIGFIHQHHKTCAPATLATIAQFWQVPAEHLEIADRICYDGTSRLSQRNWGEGNGFIVREFTITWESAIALIDRGIPFSLSTQQATDAHLQTVIGYDSRLRLLIVRDPFQRYMINYDIDRLLEHQRMSGPEGMVLVPIAHSSLLADIELSDTKLYDLINEMALALEINNRELAKDIYQQLEREVPNHRLTQLSAMTLANYDGDRTAYFNGIQKLLEKYPDNINLLVSKIHLLAELSRRTEQLQLLEQISKNDGHPIFYYLYGRTLGEDARKHDQAITLLRKALFFMPTNAEIYFTFANILWGQRRFETAFELYRFATCLEDKNESYAIAYFSASIYFKQTEAALQFLIHRFERYGKKSSVPAQILFCAYDQLCLTSEGFDILEQAEKFLPDDGSLLLYKAKAYAKFNKISQAEHLIERAKGRVSEAVWFGVAAQVAMYAGESERALDLYQELIKLDPLSIDCYNAIAQLLAELQDYDAALLFLEEATQRFPFNFAINNLWSLWVYEDNPNQDLELAEKCLRQLLEINSDSDVTLVRLVAVLELQGRLIEADAAIKTAMQINPFSPIVHSVYGFLCSKENKTREAKSAYKAAIKLSVDFVPAINKLISLTQTEAERREVLAFVYQELGNQVISGEGLLTYGFLARDVLSESELTDQLREGIQARPDLWQSWKALIYQLKLTEQKEEALTLALTATERFPLLPSTWLDLAMVYDELDNIELEIEALQRALEINPRFNEATWQLCYVYINQSNFVASQSILEKAITLSPLEVNNYNLLAEVQWKADKKAEAIANLEKAIALNPSNDWAWNQLSEWTTELEEPDRDLALAYKLTEKRIRDTRSWFKLSQILAQKEKFPEALEAIERTTALNYRCWDAHELKAKILYFFEEIDLAIAACQPQTSEPVTASLRTFEAALEHKKGNTNRSLKILEQVFINDPSYYHAKEIAATIYSQKADKYYAREYLGVATAMVELEPKNPHGWYYRSQAKRILGDLLGSRADFFRALELNPEYKEGYFVLCDYQLIDRVFDAAAQTIQLLEETCSDQLAPILFCKIRLFIGQRKFLEAQNCLRELCLIEGDEAASFISEAITMMKEQRLYKQIEEVFQSAITDNQVNPLLGAYLINYYTEKNYWRKCEHQIQKMELYSQLWQKAIGEYVIQLANHNQNLRYRAFVFRHKKKLHRETYPWIMVAHSYMLFNDCNGAIAWMKDWQKRVDLGSWMLFNLTSALRWVGRDREAKEVSLFAIGLAADNCTTFHLVYLAICAALAGETETAISYLNGIDQTSLDDRERFHYSIAEILINVQTEQSHLRLRVGRSQLKKCLKQYPQYAGDKYIRRLYTQTVWRIAKDADSQKAKIWTVWEHICLTFSSDQQFGYEQLGWIIGIIIIALIGTVLVKVTGMGGIIVVLGYLMANLSKSRNSKT